MSNILSEISDFSKDGLKKTETAEKDVMPTSEGKIYFRTIL